MSKMQDNKCPKLHVILNPTDLNSSKDFKCLFPQPNTRKIISLEREEMRLSSSDTTVGHVFTLNGYMDMTFIEKAFFP
jgi:hypothetical protein